jgi:hypothetical protein
VVFTVTVDVCLVQLKQRFHSFKEISNLFSFLMPEQLRLLTDTELNSATSDFAAKYSEDVSTDIVGQFLALRSCLKESETVTSPRGVLEFIVEHKLQSMLPDVVTAYMLYLTLPVTVATCERSFSKLRIIKNYLRSSCGQERLSNLGLLAIESSTARSLNLDSIINDCFNESETTQLQKL